MAEAWSSMGRAAKLASKLNNVVDVVAVPTLQANGPQMQFSTFVGERGSCCGSAVFF